MSLYLSKSYSNKIEDIVPAEEIAGGESKSNLELLIDRIKAIQQKIPPHALYISENEKAFTEAAEEQYNDQAEPVGTHKIFALRRRKK